MSAVLLDAYTDWECPACGPCNLERTRPLPPNASRFDTCPKLHMLTAPLVRAWMAARWSPWSARTTGAAKVTHEADDGRAGHEHHHQHADGHNDVAVLAPKRR